MLPAHYPKTTNKIENHMRLNVSKAIKSEVKRVMVVEKDVEELCLCSAQAPPHSTTAQCAVCKVRCHCIFYGPGIRYSDIFGAPGIRYSVIIKLPCALLQTGHLETVHAPVTDTVTYFAGLDAPVVDTVTYFGGNHRSRV